MEGNESVRKLIVGSKAIDQMRKEVDTFVRVVTGLLKNSNLYPWKASAWPNPAQTIFRGYNHWWIVSDRSDGKSHLKIECWLTGPLDSLAYSNFDGTVLTMCEAQRVHEALPTFKNGMKETFNLTNNLQVLLDAADYAEQNGW